MNTDIDDSHIARENTIAGLASALISTIAAQLTDDAVETEDNISFSLNGEKLYVICCALGRSMGSLVESTSETSAGLAHAFANDLVATFERVRDHAANGFETASHEPRASSEKLTPMTLGLTYEEVGEHANGLMRYLSGAMSCKSGDGFFAANPEMLLKVLTVMGATQVRIIESVAVSDATIARMLAEVVLQAGDTSMEAIEAAERGELTVADLRGGELH